jgi:Fur family transcriptional regulator, ferric uptake regulator
LNLNKVHETFRSYLKEGGFRITPERFEILDAIAGYPGHFIADELFIAMRTKNSEISRATVYNTLELLSNCNLLSKRNFGENKSRYESNFEFTSHDHLICNDCGSIIEFSSPKIKKIIEETTLELGFEPTGYSLNVFGKCGKIHKCKNVKNGK